MATSSKQDTVTASLILCKLGSYPRQNGLAVALRERGRLFILDWLQSVALRRRAQVGLNKGEARNALAQAVFFHWLGEIQERGFELPRYRASGPHLQPALRFGGSCQGLMHLPGVNDEQGRRCQRVSFKINPVFHLAASQQAYRVKAVPVRLGSFVWESEGREGLQREVLARKSKF